MTRNRRRTLALENPGRIALFLAVWLSLFAYAGRPLLAGAAVAGIAPAIAWLALLVAALLPVVPWLVQGRGATHWTSYVMLAFFSTLFGLVVIGDVLRGGYALMRWLLASSSSVHPWPILDARALSLTILVASGALSLVGVAQARCPRLRHITVPIDELPEELEGYRIVQWSDVHVGPTIKRDFVQALVERTNALDADAVAITGDFVDGEMNALRNEVQPVLDLRTRDGVFYVTGNHEYYWRVSEWLPVLQETGMDFLRNEHRVVTRGGAQIVFAGVTDPVGRDAHAPDPDRALAGAPAGAVKILLSHRPQTAEHASRLGAHLQLSGHTHGGQFFPFNLVIKRFQPIAKGLHKVGRTWLYVNRGTGYWGPPTRLAVGGEITVISLTRSA